MQPPPANPYPRVTGSGMYVRRLRPVGQVFLCLHSTVSPGNALTITVPCRVTVRVNAPDPARSKTLTVWSGSCRYDSTRLN